MPSTSHALILLLLAGCSPLVVDFKDGVPTDDGIGTDSGSAVAPDISVDPPAIDFGVVLVGETATATFTVANVGDAPLTTAASTLHASVVVPTPSPAVAATARLGPPPGPPRHPAPRRCPLSSTRKTRPRRAPVGRAR